ncbi:MAG: LL-diaminopimelate aminotransferase [Hyphomicrobiales bacterium]|nr:LL-diaminopimelate aminotransferase [Hyphomicrobiales bacterium]
MSAEFHRIKQLPPYVFESVNKLKAKYRSNGDDIIDLGMGNPDMQTPLHIRDKLIETINKPKTNRYSASKGISGLLKAQAAYYDRRFGVKLKPESEIVATLGSKEGFANIAQAITAPGDIILAPNPTYPIHQFGFIISGGVIRNMPATPDEDFIRRLENEVVNSFPKPKVLVVNYPSNPTALNATLDFYKEIVSFCRKHELIILSDLAYAEIYFDDNPPPSILQVNGAKSIAVEFTSMSKTYAMPGWRIGFAVGNERIISALIRVKSYLDYGAYTPIQVAAATALNSPQDCVEEIRLCYKNRRDTLIKSFSNSGWLIPEPQSSMFAWAPIPHEFKDLGSIEFSKVLLKKTKVAVSPGIGFGSEGDGHVRIALVENEHRIRQAARNIKKDLFNK